MKIHQSHALFAIIMVLSANAMANTDVPLASGSWADEALLMLASPEHPEAMVPKRKNIRNVPGLSIRAVAHLAPNLDSPDRPLYRPNAMTGIEQNRAVGVGSAAFTPLLENHIFNPADIISWQNPRYRLEVGFAAIRTDAEIILSKFSYRIRSSDVSATRPNGSVSFQGTLDGAYSTTRQGIPFGNDLIKGTADDPPRLLGGPAGTPLRGEIAYLGFGIFYTVASAAEAEAVNRYIVENNLTITFEYFYDGTLVTTRTIRFAPVQPRAPLIASFTAEPVHILFGRNTALRWTTTDATTVTITPGVGNVGMSGTATVAPTQSTLYTLTAIGAGGTGVQATVQVTVTPPSPPPVMSPAVLSTNITASITLTPNGAVVAGTSVTVSAVLANLADVETPELAIAWEIDTGSGWKNWPDGFSKRLFAREHFGITRTWNVGDVDHLTYQFRIRATGPGIDLVSNASEPLRIVPRVTLSPLIPGIRLRIEPRVENVVIAVQGPAGTYQIQEQHANTAGQWIALLRSTKGTTNELKVLVPRREGNWGLFRVAFAP